MLQCYIRYNVFKVLWNHRVLISTHVPLCYYVLTSNALRTNPLHFHQICIYHFGMDFRDLPKKRELEYKNSNQPTTTAAAAMVQSIHCSIKSASCRIHDNNTLIVIDSSNRRQTWSETTHQLKCRRTHSLIQLLFKPYYKRFLPLNFPILKKLFAWKRDSQCVVYASSGSICHGVQSLVISEPPTTTTYTNETEKKFVQCKSHFSCRVKPINLTWLLMPSAIQIL